MGWTNGPYLRNLKKMISAPRTNGRANFIEPIIEWANAPVPPTPFQGVDIYMSYIYNNMLVWFPAEIFTPKPIDEIM